MLWVLKKIFTILLWNIFIHLDILLAMLWPLVLLPLSRCANAWSAIVWACLIFSGRVVVKVETDKLVNW